MSALVRSLRILRENWKLTAIAIFSLSIAMAIGVICLSVSDTSLFVPPAGAEPDRLVAIYSRTRSTEIDHISYPDYQFLRDNNRVFTEVAAMPESITAIRTTFGAAGQTNLPIVTIAYNPVSENYFSVLGIRPFLGRLFARGDDASNAATAVMTYSCWKRLGSDPNIVGKNVGRFSIIGVTPKEFTGSLFGINGDLVVPLSRGDTANERDARRLYLLARLRPGVSQAEAQSNITVLSHQLASAYPKEDKDRMAVLTRATLLPPDAIPAAKIVMGVALLLGVLVLLIACANVANLLLAVTAGRRQEATIKLAIGASRGRVIRDFLREGAMICAASGMLAYALAALITIRYSHFSVDVPMLGEYSFGLKLHLGGTVIASSLGLMCIAVLATGLPAALYASSSNLSAILSGEMVGGPHKTKRRNALVIVQVAVCTLVLVGMGLCERSLYNLRHVNPGFSARNLTAVELFDEDDQGANRQTSVLYQRARQNASTLPGIESVALGVLPLLGNDNRVPIRLHVGEKPVSIGSGTADEDYFATLGIPVLSGRTFNSADSRTSIDSIVINRKMAEMLWPGQDAVGRTLQTGDPSRNAVVVGVVADGKYGGLDESAQPFFYYTSSQDHPPEFLIARTKGDPRLWSHALTEAVGHVGLHPALEPITFENLQNLSLLPERIVAGGVTALGALALLLAAVGLFGAVSYAVSERKKEFGIRTALGAQPSQLLAMILRQTLSIAGAGTVIGVTLEIGVTVFVSSNFYGIGAVEWSVLIPVVALMLAICLSVAYLSAKRWVRVDPLETVRHA